MAKYEKSFQGDFNKVLSLADNTIMQSMSASLEDSSDIHFGNVRAAIRVYERYSWMGQNRVSLNLTLIGEGEHLFITVITSGGSQAVFQKLNTFGEEGFLRPLANALEHYSL